MITIDQATNWLWQRYLDARSMDDIDFWFDRFQENRLKQREQLFNDPSLEGENRVSQEITQEI